MLALIIASRKLLGEPKELAGIKFDVTDKVAVEDNKTSHINPSYTFRTLCPASALWSWGHTGD